MDVNTIHFNLLSRQTTLAILADIYKTPHNGEPVRDLITNWFKKNYFTRYDPETYLYHFPDQEKYMEFCLKWM